jgi:hypothetical protein
MAKYVSTGAWLVVDELVLRALGDGLDSMRKVPSERSNFP